MRPAIHVLTGCTAVGKTELALRWAERHGAEIVSCDSLLFYRGANIGTAKPSASELARVRHHLIDICPVTSPMNVATYVGMARSAVCEIVGRGARVLVTGGSGFYLKSFFSPVADDVAVDGALREEIQRELERNGLPALVTMLRELNPEGLGNLDVQNPRRVTRALERCRASGLTLVEMRRAFDAQPAPFSDYDVRLCELVRNPAELEERIVARVHAMVRAGLVDEVRGLVSEGLKANPSAAGAIGYRETIEHLEGRLSAAELPLAIVANTKALVRKQRTWFRTQLPAHETRDAASAGEDGLFTAPV